MSAPVSEGDIVLDKYRVERVLGRGGMGVVVAATHVDLDQKVALKFLLPSALEHPEIVERFAREAKAAAKIQSQHVVRVIDTGKMPSGAPFMVMEYLEGEDLGDVLKRSGVLEPNVVADYLLQACEAIGEAHAAGIIHRDLKPSNLFLAKQRDRRSIVKVLDFGISKLDEPDAAPLTKTTTAMGSPHYMSPEQLISSKHVDARTDIWSLGVILYELVAGSRPFEAETMPEIVAQVLNNKPERLSAVREDIGLDFELVVARCLASEKENRYASVAELAAALRPFATDAASASASVERIARVLGGASIPPTAESPVARPGMILTIDVPAKDDGAGEVAATVRPPAAGPPTKTAPTQPAPTASPKSETKKELGLAATTPSTDLVGAVQAVQAERAEERGGSRVGIYAAAGVGLVLVAVIGLRAGGTTGGEHPGASPTAPATATATATATASATAPATAAASATAAAPATAAATAAATASASASAVPEPVASAVPAVRPSAPAAKPTTKPTATAAASASARPQPTRDTLQMDIK